MDLEQTIKFLQDKGVTVTAISNRVLFDGQPNRGMFYSRRGSIYPERRNELKKKIINAFTEYFPEGQDYEEEQEEQTEAEYQKKYIALLETNINDLKKERDELRQQLTETTKELIQNMRK